jgi:hypothetical protein
MVSRVNARFGSMACSPSRKRMVANCAQRTTGFDVATFLQIYRLRSFMKT